MNDEAVSDEIMIRTRYFQVVCWPDSNVFDRNDVDKVRDFRTLPKWSKCTPKTQIADLSPKR
jgi:hypothetical protein